MGIDEELLAELNRYPRGRTLRQLESAFKGHSIIGRLHLLAVRDQVLRCSKGTSIRWLIMTDEDRKVKERFRQLEAMIKEHGLTENGWSATLDQRKNRAGVCIYRNRTISVSRYHLLNSDMESVLDTFVHEIAHALVGSAAGHGPVWKAKAQELGGTGDISCDAFTVGRFKISCAKGCRVYTRHRVTKRWSRLMCRICKGEVRVRSDN